jgi:ABC-type glutathione transport system ATPase component
MTQNEKTTLEIRNLSVVYKTNQKKQQNIRAVENCSLSVSKGEMIGLVGESGSGKTSLLMAIPRLLPQGTEVAGQILCDGTDLLKLDENAINAWRWRRVALVPQGAMNSFTPHLTVGRHITETLECHPTSGTLKSKERAADLLNAVGLEAAFLSRYPHELSGGQKQRAALALSLACEPDFLLADEPTTALDVITQKDVLDMIAALARERGMGLLLVTHDLPLAAGICDVLAVMKDGEIVEKGPARRVADAPEHPYTARLIRAIRDIEMPERRG